MKHSAAIAAHRPGQTAVLILGMHRSGTSLLSSLVQSLGISVGENLYPADAHNPAGYFEDRECVDIQERMLGALGQPWHGEKGMLPFPSLWWREPAMRPLVAELENWIDRRISSGAPIWALKDPRTTRFLPLWQELLEARGIAARYVLAVRDPAAVIASEVTRDNVPAPRIYHTWLRYNMEALLHAGADLAGIFVYAHWFTDGAAQLRRLAGLLGVNAPDDEFAAILDRMLRSDLHRQDGSGERPPVWASRFYEHLQHLAAHPDAVGVTRLATEAEYLDALLRQGEEPATEGALEAVLCSAEGAPDALKLARGLLAKGARVVLGVAEQISENSAPGVAAVVREYNGPTVLGEDHLRAAYSLWRWLQQRAYAAVHVEGGHGLATHLLDARRQGWHDGNGAIHVHYFMAPSWLEDDGSLHLHGTSDAEALCLERRVLSDQSCLRHAAPALEATLRRIAADAPDYPPAPDPTSPDEPLVSVCITHYNRPALLHDCLASVRAQTYGRFEVVLVDDGSTQPAAQAYLDTLEQEFAAKGWILIRQENRYLGAARNAAAGAARGDYLFFLDDDNLLLADGLQRAVQVAQRTGADIVTAAMAMFQGPAGHQPTRPDTIWVHAGNAPLLSVLFNNNLGDANALIRRSCWAELGGYTEDRNLGAEDWEFFAKTVLQGRHLEHSLKSFSWYRIDPNGMARSGNWWRDCRRAMRAYEALLPPSLRELPTLARVLATRVSELEPFEPEAINLHQQVNQLTSLMVQTQGELAQTHEALAQLHRNLAQTQGELAQARDGLAHAQDRLARTQDELASTQARLAQTQDQLALAQDGLAQTQDQLAWTQGELAQTQDRLAWTQGDLAQTQDRLAWTQGDLASILRSTSWRMTGPLRQVGARHPRVARWGRRSMRLAWWTLTLQLVPRLSEWQNSRVQLRAGNHPQQEAIAHDDGPVPDLASPPAETVETTASDDHQGLPAPNLPTSWYASYRCGADYGAIAWPRSILFSIVMPVYKVRPEWLEEAIASVRGQTSPHWEMICVDDGSQDAGLTAILQRAASDDARIRVVTLEKNQGVSRATNVGIEQATGDFILFMDHDDRLEPHALARLGDAAFFEDADIIYGDEVVTGEDTEEILGIQARPAFSHTYYLAHPFLVHPVVVRTALARQIGGLDASLTISQDIDFVLRVLEVARKVTHVPDILYRWRTSTESAGHAKQAEVMAATCALKAAHLRRIGFPDAEVREGMSFNTFSVRYFGAPSGRILAIIPTKNQGGLLRRCVETVVETTKDLDLDLLVVDHESDDPETLSYLRDLEASRTARVLPYRGEFNYSAINNYAVQACGAGYDHFLFLNNDIEATKPGWLEAMLDLATRADVGVVGATLLYPGGLVQHSGVIVGLHNAAEHAFKTLPFQHDNAGYGACLHATREYSAVTAACMLMPAEAFRAVRGYDEKMVVGFSDTDLCLRIGELGYRVVNCAEAILVHHESVSRGKGSDGTDPHPHDSAWLQHRYKGLIHCGDPHFSPLLARDNPTFVPDFSARLTSAIRYRSVIDFLPRPRRSSPAERDAGLRARG